MIDVKQAVAQAISHMRNLYPEDQLNDLRLEEVRVAEEGGEDHWDITIGFYPNSTLKSVLGSPGVGASRLERIYKVVRVRGSDGAFEEMSIRKVG